MGGPPGSSNGRRDRSAAHRGPVGQGAGEVRAARRRADEVAGADARGDTGHQRRARLGRRLASCATSHLRGGALADRVRVSPRSERFERHFSGHQPCR